MRDFISKKYLIILISLVFAFGSTGVFATSTDDTPPPEIKVEGLEGPPEIKINTDDDAPPGITINISDNTDDDAPPPPGGTNIDISNVSAAPTNFNPAIGNVKISFTLSKEAVVDIRIEDQNGQTVTKIIDNKKLEEGDVYVTWYGTSNNQINGTIVKNGGYKYKIIARNTETDNIEDTAEGEITVNYFTQPVTDSGTTGNNNTTNTNTTNTNSDNGYATSVLHNEFDGDTADTGPSTYIYLIFPLIGYFFYRKKFFN